MEGSLWQAQGWTAARLTSYTTTAKPATELGAGTRNTLTSQMPAQPLGRLKTDYRAQAVTVTNATACLCRACGKYQLLQLYPIKDLFKGIVI